MESSSSADTETTKWFNTLANPLTALSFYSPLIIMISIILFSLFSSAAYKGAFYLFCLFVATAFRLGVVFLYKNMNSGVNKGNNLIAQNPICETGVIFPDTDKTFSVFILCLTFIYFILPMIIITSKNKVDTINYWVLSFFAIYICYDIGVKRASECIRFDGSLLLDGLLGVAIGAVIVCSIMFTDNSGLLFINELTSNKEVCTRPSKQQFKCSVYKNGEVVGQSVTSK